MNLIERLKSNERPFGLCSEEEKACFREVGKSNIVAFSYSGDWNPPLDDGIFAKAATYRINQFYTPPPKEKKIEVIELLFASRQRTVPTANGVVLPDWLNDPSFIAFEYEDIIGSSELGDLDYRSVKPRLINPKGGSALIPKYVILAE